jgi:hypothetical protein
LKPQQDEDRANGGGRIDGETLIKKKIALQSQIQNLQ